MRQAGILREFFSLAGARAKVAARPPEVQRGVHVWWRAARARLRFAGQFDPESEFAPALALYREGLTALVGAALVAVEGAARPADVADIGAAWRALERVWPALRTGVDLAELRAAREALCNPAPLEAPPPGPVEALAATTSMARLADLLERAIEPRTPLRLALYSASRRAAVVAALAGVVAFPAARWASPRNLALHRPVKLSAVLAVDGVDLANGLVNGVIEYTYGAHTQVDGDPTEAWMMVDLERPTRIGKIVVYNRGDQNFTDCLPLILEVGTDPSSFKVLETRDSLFTRTDPWVVGHLDVTARYVRVRKEGGKPAYIALSELEVYAP